MNLDPELLAQLDDDERLKHGRDEGMYALRGLFELHSFSSPLLVTPPAEEVVQI